MHEHSVAVADINGGDYCSGEYGVNYDTEVIMQPPKSQRVQSSLINDFSIFFPPPLSLNLQINAHNFRFLWLLTEKKTFSSKMQIYEALVRAFMANVLKYLVPAYLPYCCDALRVSREQIYA